MSLTQKGDLGGGGKNRVISFFFNGYGVNIFRPILMGKVVLCR